jgi:hypothetical protein
MKRRVKVVRTRGQYRPKSASRRITDKDIKLPNLISNKLHHALDVIILADVRLDYETFSAESRNFVSDFRRRSLRTYVIDDDIGTGCGKADGAPAPDPARTTRHQRHATTEVYTH